ncbi:MAG TPA: bifunctional riboflavin kinase/FAD synthetase [Rhizomicrobium sp.]|jgi:riboflavin kinase/FMN adenylyltransferase
MRIFRHYNDVTADCKGAVVAIGNFDGVHLGHQALIAHTGALAKEKGGLLGVVAFEPHPQEFFGRTQDIFRLTPFRTKARLLADRGVDAMYALNFDAEMASMPAERFIDDVLVKGLGVKGVVVGSDFRFGKGRTGTTETLIEAGKRLDFAVNIFEPVFEIGIDKISSTHIREALRAGKPEYAAKLLGHYWSVESRVEHGDARGRTIGFPTANMHIDDTLKPAYGVYAARATVFEDEKPTIRRDGVANFGIRPMYRIPQPLLETFLFDFSGDLYGKHLAVEFVHFIRGEAKFDGLEALKAQIAKDAEVAKKVLASA